MKYEIAIIDKDEVNLANGYKKKREVIYGWKLLYK